MWPSRSKQEIRMMTLHKEQIMEELNKLDNEHRFTLTFDGEMYSLWTDTSITEKEGDKDAGDKG